MASKLTPGSTTTVQTSTPSAVPISPGAARQILSPKNQPQASGALRDGGNPAPPPIWFIVSTDALYLTGGTQGVVSPIGVSNGLLLGLTGSVNGIYKIPIVAQSSDALRLFSTGMVEHGVSGTAAASQNPTGSISGTFTVPVVMSASDSIRLITGGAWGAVYLPVSGTSAVTLALAGQVAGNLKVTGTSAVSLVLSGTGNGGNGCTATSAASLALSGTAGSHVTDFIGTSVASLICTGSSSGSSTIPKVTGTSADSLFASGTGLMTASNYTFFTGNGSSVPSGFSFPGSLPAFNPSVTSFTETDWQGTLQLWNTPRTNQLYSSDNFASTDWARNGVALTPSVADPKGGTSAFTLTASAAGADFYNTGSVAGGSVFQTWTMWMRRRTGSGPVSMADPTGTWHAVTLTGTWQRFAFSGVNAGNFSIVLATSGDAIDIAFGDCVNGTVVGRHIYTPLGGTNTYTDYTLTGSSLMMAEAPLAGATLAWSGTGTAPTVGLGGLINGTFIFPAITSFTPTTGGIGTVVTITGTNLTGANSVKFNGTNAASFTVVNSTTITATVTGGTSSGPISVTTSIGTCTSPGSFIFAAAPTITSFTPTTGGFGNSVAITGTNFTGTTAVSFGGTAATSFTVNSSTLITAVVGTGSTGNVSVTTPGGSVSSSGFTYGGVVSVSIAPTSATVAEGATQVLTATVTGNSNTAVSWATTSGTIAVIPSAPSIRQNYFATSNVVSGISVVAGDLILVAITYGNSPETVTCTDTASGGSNTYNSIGSVSPAYNDASLNGLYAVAKNTETLTITAALVSTNYQGMQVTVVQGCNGTLASVLDTYAWGALESAASSTHATGSITTTSPNDILFSFVAQAWVAGSGWTENGTGFTNIANAEFLGAFTRIAATPGSYVDDYSFSTATYAGSLLVAFKALGGSGNSALFTAPGTTGSCTVTATSSADSSKSASAAITVTGVSNSVTSVTLSPTSLSLVEGTTSTVVTATVNFTGTEATSVTWALSGGGSLTSVTGTTCTVLAGSSLGSWTLTATSTADPSKSANLTVTVTASGSGSLAITSPVTATAVGSGGTLQFSANQASSWSVDGVAGGSSTVGTINSSGLYTAPTVTSQAVHTVTATSGSYSASLDICIAISNTVINAHTTYGATGNGSTDDTVAINNAMAATGNGICRLPYTGNPYMINASTVSGKKGVVFNPGNTLLLDPGVVLQTITNSTDPTNASEYNTLAMSGLGTCNMALVGGTVIGDRLTAANPGGRNIPNFNTGSGPYFEAGAGLEILNGVGYVVLGTRIQDCCMDGIYTCQGSVNPSHILVQGVTSNNNRRQGMSICAGDTITLKNSTFSNTNGNDPGCGIDLEPSGSGQTVTNVNVLGCQFIGNKGGGFIGGSSAASVDNILIDSCTFTGNGGQDYGVGGIYINDGASYLTITNNTINGSVSTSGDNGGIRLDSISHAVVNNNTGSSNGGYGLYFSSCSSTTYAGNTLTGASGTVGGDGSATVGSSVTSVTLNPTSLSLITGATSSTVTATVNFTGTEPTSVTWTLSGGGSLTNVTGTSCTVVAGSSVGSWTLTATSTADTSKSASLTVAVGTLTITSPTAFTAVGSGGTLSFTANASVNWSVDGIAGGSSAVGTINSSGVYTCPATSVPILHTITATLASDSTKTASKRILATNGNVTYDAHATYGATGNGTTDDTNAITSALSAAAGNICVLSAGTYLVNPILNDGQTCALQPPANTCLWLKPGAIIKINATTPPSNMRIILLSNNNTTVVGGEIVGDRASRLPTNPDGYYDGDGINIANNSGSIVFGTYLHDHCDDGIYIFRGSVNPTNFTISDVVSDHNRRQALSITEGNNGTFQFSTFSNTNGYTSAGSGVDLEPASNSVTGITINQCSMINNYSTGISGGATGQTCSGIIVTNCTITGNGNAGGIYVNDGAASWTISNNTVSSNGRDGIRLSGVSAMTVNNNTCNSNTGYGMLFTSCGSGSTYHGNTESSNAAGTVSNDGTMVAD